LTLDDDRQFPAEPPQTERTASESAEQIPPNVSTPGSGDFAGPVAARITPKFVPEDLRAPWGWLDLVLITCVGLAIGLVLLIIVTAGFVALGHHPSELQRASRTSGVFGVAYEALLVSALMGFLALYMRLRFGLPFWRTIGWRPLETSRFPRGLTYVAFIVGGFSLAIFAELISALFGSKAKVPMEALFQDRVVALLLLLMSVLMAPVVEETLFRGLLYPVFARSLGQGAGVVVVGTLFGLLHSAQLWGGWTQIGVLVCVGIILTYVRAVKRTVFASFLLHLSYNFFISSAFFIGTHGLRVLPTGS
jgi:membrane protease YdiL (CAAX protease family)